MPEEKKKGFIEGLVCKINKETGEILCKIDRKQYNEITKSKPPRRITFELEED